MRESTKLFDRETGNPRVVIYAHLTTTMKN